MKPLRSAVLDDDGPFAAPVNARGETLREQVRSYERRLIVRAISDAGGDRRQAAARLGIGLSSLYRKLAERGSDLAEGAGDRPIDDAEAASQKTRAALTPNNAP
jgi:DNA-binding NtrC family response regulator